MADQLDAGDIQRRLDLPLHKQHQNGKRERETKINLATVKLITKVVTEVCT